MARLKYLQIGHKHRKKITQLSRSYYYEKFTLNNKVYNQYLITSCFRADMYYFAGEQSGAFRSII